MTTDEGFDEQTLRLAAFMAQALELEDDPTALANELVRLKRDPQAAIFSIELESSVGPAAFLLYHYRLDERGDDGRSGRELFDADLATLERAAGQDTPGPRILAHATADREAFILATTPAIFRALTGAPDTRSIEATPAALSLTGDPVEARREAASELLRLLQEANQQATTWLAALGASGKTETANGESPILFNEEEAALALFLLDERSIRDLLQTLNLLISSAHQQAAQAAGEPPDT
jgi:hypothetical protein